MSKGVSLSFVVVGVGIGFGVTVLLSTGLPWTVNIG